MILNGQETMLKKILIVFGTRPEAIKMAPLVKAFLANESFITKVCVTGQHRQMLDQVLSFFEISPDYDLNLMLPNQTLYQLTGNVITGMEKVVTEYNPNYIFVHGDTTTSTFAALAGFYNKSIICHIEAGLRTYNRYSPFPEEINRQLTARLATWHFTPTELSKNNLLSENISAGQIVITGNTVIDALLWAKDKVESFDDTEITALKGIIKGGKKIILVTGHRRENFGKGFENICKALLQLSARSDIQIIYPVHFNPNVKDTVFLYLQGKDNISLIEPLAYPAFVWLMKRSHIILTDSGGIQEEAPSLGKPVLVMRDTTERPEAIEYGTAKLVGANTDTIINEVCFLLDRPEEYNAISLIHNPYGDGEASNLIVHFLREQVENDK
jgi:UDP-N-acetylglucosamine 2-epimerase (non-hydrolysing)